MDPGLAATGYGVVEGGGAVARILDFGCVRTTPAQPGPERLAAIFEAIQALIERWQPGGMAMEDIFSAPRAPRAAVSLGEVRGVISLAAAQARLLLLQLPAREVKQALTGSGAADKEQVEKALRRVTGWSETIRPNHASDALAIAIIGLSRGQSPMSPHNIDRLRGNQS